MHRYIAVHQTYMEHLLKVRLRELSDRADDSGAESEDDEAGSADERISVDMDFAENYEIVHKVEIQSEHWQHQQVTLFIVITNFKSEGKWKSEAHIFVSSDRSHELARSRPVGGQVQVFEVVLVLHQHTCRCRGARECAG